MRRTPHYKLQRIGTEFVLIPLGEEVKNRNGVISFNAVAAFLWDNLAEERSFEELTAAALERFDVKTGVVHEDVRAFIHHLTELGLILRDR